MSADWMVRELEAAAENLATIGIPAAVASPLADLLKSESRMGKRCSLAAAAVAIAVNRTAREEGR